MAWPERLLLTRECAAADRLGVHVAALRAQGRRPVREASGRLKVRRPEDLLAQLRRAPQQGLGLLVPPEVAQRVREVHAEAHGARMPWPQQLLLEGPGATVHGLGLRTAADRPERTGERRRRRSRHEVPAVEAMRRGHRHRPPGQLLGLREVAPDTQRLGERRRGGSDFRRPLQRLPTGELPAGHRLGLGEAIGGPQRHGQVAQGHQGVLVPGCEHLLLAAQRAAVQRLRLLHAPRGEHGVAQADRGAKRARVLRPIAAPLHVQDPPKGPHGVVRATGL
mmetsp:Transcript_122201/g.353331  ORF Transcript_122201/g.353331 Transcript_122201/m.353331 type:complete len:279 (+) Transcript_122201:407-1243(+)